MTPTLQLNSADIAEDARPTREHNGNPQWQLEDELKMHLRGMEPSERVAYLQICREFWQRDDAPSASDTALARTDYVRLIEYAIAFFTDVCDTDSVGQQNWRAGTEIDGYGADYNMPWVSRRVQGRAHKIAWVLLHGPIPAGMVVRHSCETPNSADRTYRTCCHVDHLSLGTTADNVADMIARGRRPPAATRVTDSEREKIRAWYLDGASIMEISVELRRSVGTIRAELRRAGIEIRLGRRSVTLLDFESDTMKTEQLTEDADPQVAVPGTAPLLPPRAGCTPPLKWVGSKRWLVPTLAPSIYERLATTKGRYIEPFLGGGAVALDLGLPNMRLADTCKPLIAMYQTIRKSPGAVAWALQTLVDKGTDKESYLAVRASEPPSVVFAAARFLYLNKFGFNGLYRENRRGKFNVPHGGDRSSASLPDANALADVASALKGADLRVADFRETIATAQTGDVVYADSPYYETFDGYVAGGFTEADHFALATSLVEAHNRGAVIIASNSDHERIRELYGWAFITPVHERHAVGATGARRGLRPAVLIVSDETILRGA